MKKPLLILVSNPRIASGVLTKEFLANFSHDYHIVVSHDSRIDSRYLRDLPYKTIKFQETRIRLKFQKLILDLETLLESTRNVSFDSRIRLLLGIPVKSKIGLKIILMNRSKYGILLLLLKYFCKFQFIRLNLRRLSDNLSGVNNLKFEENFCGAIIFSGGNYSGFENSAIYVTRNLGIPSMLVIDNWDNMSSKSILWNHPDLVAVWGEDMEEDASLIHGICKENLVRIGSSRVIDRNTNRELFDNKLQNVLFVGSGLRHSDELGLLLESSKALARKDPKIHLIYRPHPFQLTSESIHEINKLVGDYKNISVAFSPNDDTEMNFYTSRSFENLNESILSAQFVIGTHSTVLVEALVLGREVIAYSLAESGVFSGVSVWDRYVHLSRLRANKSVRETTSRQEFIQFVEQLIPAPQIENLAPEIIYEDNLRYWERLLKATKVLVGDFY